MLKKLMNELGGGHKEEGKAVVALLIFYGIFFYYFVTVPPFGDRWMENREYVDLGSVWKYLWTQFCWTLDTNGRWISNLFSAIVDRNIPFRAACNAGMMCGIAILIFRICKIEKFKMKLIVYALFFLVSAGILAEVYFFATTLYVSGMLLMFLVFYYALKVSEGEKKYNIWLYVLTFIACIWLENISFSVLVLSAMLLFFVSLREKTISKPFLLMTLFSLVGFAYLYVESVFAGSGRLSTDPIPLHQINWDFVGILIYDNAFFVVVIGILALNLLWIRRKEETSKKICSIQCIWWCIIIFFCLLCLLNQLYVLIASGSGESYIGAWGWRPFASWTFEQMIRMGSEFMKFLLLGFVCISVASLLYIVLKSKNKLVGLLILAMILADAFFSLYINFCSRVTCPAVFATFFFIGWLFQECDRAVSYRILNMLCILVCLAALLNMEDTRILLKKGQEIEQERNSIIEIVKERQALGEWDDSKEVMLPAYPIYGQTVGKGFIYSANTYQSEPHYPFMLKYYGLNENTKIVYK